MTASRAVPAGPLSLTFRILPLSLAYVTRYSTFTLGSLCALGTVVPGEEPATGTWTLDCGVDVEAAVGPLETTVGAVIGKVTWTLRTRPSSTKNAATLTVAAFVSRTSIA